MTAEEHECRQSWHAAALDHHDRVDGDHAEWCAHQNLFFRCHRPDAHMPPAERYRPHLREARRKLGLPQ